MSVTENLVNLYNLLAVEGIGTQKIFLLLNYFKNFRKILDAAFSQLLEVEGIGEVLAKNILRSQDLRQEAESKALKHIELLEKMGASFTTLIDDDYPSALRNIFAPPSVLYYKGSLLQEDSQSLAIVGTRRPTQYGRKITEEFTAHLVHSGLVIISGLAFGIDTIAHQTALTSGGRTIAVLGGGLDKIYPAENVPLAQKITASGAIVTEYEPGTVPQAGNFPRRNRIISGFALGTLLVESMLTGGAMRTVTFALDQGREVFALPGNANAPYSQGTNTLIQRGEAKLVMTPEDILKELRLQSRKQDAVKPKVLPELTLFEAKIVECLSVEPISIDLVSTKSGFPISDCLVYLLMLEFKGVVRQLPGKTFALLN